jgi:hypothetical protein
MANTTIDFKIKVDGKEIDLAKTSVNQFNQIYSDTQKKLNDLPLGSPEWKKLNTELKNADTAFQQTKDTINETEGKFKSLRLQIRQATVAFQEAESKGDLKGMATAKKQLDELNDQFEVATLKAMKFEDALATMPGVAGFVGQSIQGIDKAFKVLVANPILAIVTALFSAFMFLKEALGKTKEGQGALNKVTQAFSTIMGPLLALINTVAVPIFEALANIILKVGEAFSWFAEKLGVSKASIAAATKDIDTVGQEAAENEKKRQEEAKQLAEKEAQRKKEAADKAKQAAADEKKRKEDAINDNEALAQSETELARSKEATIKDPLEAAKAEQKQKDEDFAREKKRIEDLMKVQGTTAQEKKKLQVELNNLEAAYNTDRKTRDQKVEEEILKQKKEAFEKEKEAYTTKYETLTQQRDAADEKELQDLDIKLASGQLREDEYQRQLYLTKKRQLDDKNALIKEDEQKEKDFYLNLYNNGKITKDDYEKQLLEIQKNYGQLKLENQKEVGINEFENAKAQAQLLVDLKQFQVEAETALEQAKVGALQQLGDIVAGLAGENKGLQITALLIQQAASVAQILSRSAAAKAGAVASAAPLLANPITAPAAAISLKAALTANQIATITGLAGVALAVGTGISKISSSGGGGKSEGGGAAPAAPNLGRNYEKGGMLKGPRHAQGGMMIEAEGGEAVMTRGAVTMFAPLLSAMNQMGGGTSFGNQLFTKPDMAAVSNPQQEQAPVIMKTYVVSNDLTTEQEKLARLKDLSTL